MKETQVKKNKRNRRIPAVADIIKNLQPPVMIAGGFRAEIISDREAVVWGVKSICEYRPERISLRHKSGVVHFHGCSLTCRSYVEGVVCIRGCISSLHFERA